VSCMDVSRNGLAAADGDDDLKPVSRLNQGGGMLAFRHDLAVLLDSQSFAGQAIERQQRADGEYGLEGAWRAVEGDFDHAAILRGMGWGTAPVCRRPFL